MDGQSAETKRRVQGLTGGVIQPGQPSVGLHASGFPLYQHLPDQLDRMSTDYQDHVVAFIEQFDISKLKMPTSMTFSEEGIYDNLPAEKDQHLSMPSKMSYSKEGAYESLPMRGEEGYTKGQTEVKGGKHKAFFDEPIVHESEVRRAFLQGRTLEDPDRGQKCLKCSTCPGFEEHYWRKVCKWCRCNRTQHRMDAGVKVLDLEKSIVTQDESMAKLFQKYAWVPSGIDADTVEAYFKLLPKQFVPIKGSKGEEWRKRQLFLQNAPYDTDWEKCDQLTRSELEWFKKFDRVRMREAFDIGDVVRCPDFRRPKACSECFLKEDGTHWPYCSNFVAPEDELIKKTPVLIAKEPQELHPALQNPDDMPDIKSMKKKRKASMTPAQQQAKEESQPMSSGGRCRGCSIPLLIGEIVVQIGRFEPEEHSYFHPNCVLCSQCGELLVDLRCYVDIGWEERGQVGAEHRLFCGRHWADNRRPRCAACDETIHQPKQVFELDTTWHFRHFACYVCDANLTEAATYVPRDGKPLCMDCYREHIADKCIACGLAIDASRGGGGKISIQDKHWHPDCFVCKLCKDPLKVWRGSGRVVCMSFWEIRLCFFASYSCYDLTFASFFSFEPLPSLLKTPSSSTTMFIGA
eukprot:m.179044 g.179044  ORF g.179044 m.179044 type:complete len:632 (-) comp16599_c0_seq7:1004-2899(-)